MNNLLFIDIETVPQFTDALAMGDQFNLYAKKFSKQIDEMVQIKVNEDFDGHSMDVNFQTEKHYQKNAALYAEFGKIVCVSIGHFKENNLRIKSICMAQEPALLAEVSKIMSGNFAGVVAHNGKDFDFPYLFRRMIINKIAVPSILNTINKKPWDINLYDTMEMWSGTQWKYRCGLELLAHCLGLPSPKADMDGSKVAEVYYSIFETEEGVLPFDKEEKELKRIANYCAGDVLTLANVYFRIMGMPVLKPEQVTYV